MKCQLCMTCMLSGIQCMGSTQQSGQTNSTNQPVVVNQLNYLKQAPRMELCTETRQGGMICEI